MDETPTIEQLQHRIAQLERDATEHARVVQALSESEEQHRVLYETALVGLFRTGIGDGKVLKANQAAARLMGYDTVQQLMDANIVIGDYYPAERRAELLRQLQKHGRVSDFEAHWTYPSGREQDITISAKIYPEWGYIEGVVMDITERKQLLARLLQAQKMEAVGALAGGIAHDVNNILMGIQGNVSLMLGALGKDHPHYARLLQIQDLVTSGAELTGQLLGFARGGRYTGRPTDLNMLVRKTADLFQRTRRDIRVSKVLADGLWISNVERAQLEQVLVSLCVNAGHAMPNGGELTLTTANLHIDPVDSERYHLPAGNYVRVSVTDTGAGMDEATRARVFEPFFTTKAMGRGAGLGLASSYGVIRGHGGAIDVDSAPGRGTTFSFHLPAYQGKAEHDPRPGPEVVGGSETILLVDDDEVVAMVTRQMLESLGYTVLVAHSGRDAVAAYAAQHEQIALVLLDMIMPSMSGADVCDALRAIEPNARIILSSGHSLDGLTARAMERNCDGFLQKPFQLGALSSTLREVLDRR